MRPTIKYIKQKLNNPDGLTGFEIGVHQGVNARNILGFLNIKKLYLIDPYITYSEEGRTRDYDFNQMYHEAIRRLTTFIEHGQAEFILDYSDKASVCFPNEFFDFGYIDGCHTYESITNDIMLWYPKIRIGGVLGGHDFMLRRYPGVCLAVSKFIRENDINVRFSQGSDWWFVKEKK